jgi:hypothetical protein
VSRISSRSESEARSRTAAPAAHLSCFVSAIGNLLPAERLVAPRFVETVEELSGRKVRAFLSPVSLNPDISVEVFVLEHDSADPAPESVA